MKKIVFLSVVLVLLFSCKKAEENQTNVVSEQNVYDGKGTFDKNGNVSYKAMLPKEVDGKIKVVKQIQIDDKTLFIQINTPGNNDLSQRPDQSELNIPINKIDPTQFKDTIYVHLWHDDKEVLTVQQARNIINTKCGSGFQPERCGNGVLTVN